MQITQDEVTSAVQLLITYCHEVQTLLQNDQQLLIQNDLPGLTASNQQKGVLLEKMLLQKDIIIRSTNNLNNHPNIKSFLTTLKTELASCYQSTVVNYQVVYGNLLHLKNIWDQLLATQEKTDCLYSQNGSLQK